MLDLRIKACNNCMSVEVEYIETVEIEGVNEHIHFCSSCNSYVSVRFYENYTEYVDCCIDHREENGYYENF